jgi:hypothetical protein
MHSKITTRAVLIDARFGSIRSDSKIPWRIPNLTTNGLQDRRIAGLQQAMEQARAKRTLPKKENLIRGANGLIRGTKCLIPQIKGLILQSTVVDPADQKFDPAEHRG